MNKINFVNNSAPDLSAETLNQMQDNIEEVGIAVNPTQPTTNEKVWIQKGKNLFNKNNVVQGALEGDGSVAYNDTNSTTDFIPVSPNKTYCKTVSSSGRVKLYYKDKTPYSDGNRDIANFSNAITFTIPEDIYYIRFSFSNSTIDTLQLEQGSTATEYEEFVYPNIYTKNNNSYEKLIRENDVAISSTQPNVENVWIDNVNNIIKAKNDSGDFTTIYDDSKNVHIEKYTGTIGTGESFSLDMKNAFGILPVRCYANMMEVYKVYAIMGNNGYAFSHKELLSFRYIDGGDAEISIVQNAGYIRLNIQNTGSSRIAYVIGVPKFI